MSSIGYIYAYGQIGRLTDFRHFSSELQLPDTHYTMNVTKVTDNHAIILRNMNNNYELKITNGNISANPEFFTFLSEGKTYFILKTEGLFEEGAMYLQIYNLGEDHITPVVSSTTSDPTLNRSCVYPQLYDNKLFFEDALDCEIYPFLVENQYFYSVNLFP